MYQTTTIIGNLGRNPEMTYLPNGTPVTTVSVATSRRWTDAAGVAQERTTWWRVSAWRKLAEVCNQYLAKGRQVMVEGEASVSAWLGKDGEAMATLELRANTVKFLGGKSDAAPISVDDVDAVPF